MLEADEIFDCAQETGYRLCGVEHRHTTNMKVFSVCWDVNKASNRLFICSQDGGLVVFDADSNETNHYSIVFKKSSPFDDMSKEEEKEIHLHWDKLTTLPGRPSEIIFLLGVSRTLMYTALPNTSSDQYVKEPFLSSQTRGGFSGYIYGTPVMEISSHAARVTSMCVSMNAHVLASGDEQGNVRLLLLRLLDNFSVYRKEEQRQKRFTNTALFTPFQSSYNIISNAAHEGPIFSVHWLPGVHNAGDMRYYSLATGSSDRAVRLWNVRCCTREGICMTPMLILDTMSTHILSLNAYSIHLNPGDVSDDEEDIQSASSACSELERQEKDEWGSVFLTAATNLGTVYVWRLRHCVLEDATVRFAKIMGDGPHGGRERDLSTPKNNPKITNSNNSNTVVAGRTEFAGDDGSHLYSLVQASEHPVIHASCTVMSGSAYGSGVVLVASDTRGSVTIHCVSPLGSENTSSSNSNNSATTPRTAEQEADRLKLGLSEHTIALQQQYAAKLASMNMLAQPPPPSLILIGEQQYPVPVVCCCFREGVATLETLLEHLSIDGTEVDESEPTTMSRKSSRLFVCTAEGNMQYYPVGTMVRALKRGATRVNPPPVSAVFEAANEDEDGKEEEQEEGGKGKSSRRGSAKKRLSAAPASSSSRGAAAAVIYSPQSAISSDDSASLQQKHDNRNSSSNSSSSSRDRTSRKAGENKRAEESPPPPPPLPLADGHPFEEQQDFLPRSKPPPLPSPASSPTKPLKPLPASVAVTVSRASKETTTNTTTVISRQIKATTTTNDSSSGSGSGSGSSNARRTIDRAVVDCDGKPLKLQMIDTQGGGGPPPGAVDCFQLPAYRSPQQQQQQQAQKGTAGLLSAFATGGESVGRLSAATSRVPLHKGVDTDLKYLNKLGTPVINSSTLLEQRLYSLQQGGERDADELSVAARSESMMTTDSDRAYAMDMVKQLRGAASSSNNNAVGCRYHNLSSLGEHVPGLAAAAGGGGGAGALGGATRVHGVIAKQVDRAWLNRKKYGGPSEQDLHALYAPDPLVELRLDSSSSSSSTGGGGGGAESSAADSLQFARTDDGSSSSSSCSSSFLQPHRLSRFSAPVSLSELMTHHYAADFDPMGINTHSITSSSTTSSSSSSSLASSIAPQHQQRAVYEERRVDILMDLVTQPLLHW